MRTIQRMTTWRLTVLLMAGCSACLAADGVEPKANIVARPFTLGDVRLLDGPFKAAMEINKAYLLELDADRMLWPYHERAGLPVKGERYGGWAQRDLVGQTSGHYLSALALMYASTGDHVFKERIDYMVSEIARAQEAHGDGYTGPVRTEVWERIAAGDLAAHKWGVGGGYVPWYVMHKTFAGLIDAYVHADSKQALEVVANLADWAKRVTDTLDEAQFQDMLRSEFGGMNESLANLYALTGNKDHLLLANRFEHTFITDPLAEQRDELTGRHVNTQVPKIIGSARLYELTAQPRDATIARFFWDRAINPRDFAPGGVDLNERFFATGEEASRLAWNTSETCSVHNMLKLTRHLFGWEPDAAYMDYYERALYNQILGSQDPESGGFTYFNSLNPGHFKIYSTPFDSMWCCVGTGIENHAKYGDTIYFHNDDTLWVNLFIPSELQWKEKGATIRQETAFPETDTTTFTVSARQPQTFNITVRVPYWVTQAPQVTINGEKQAVEAKPSSYLTLSRTWEDGDTIQVQLPMGLHLRRARDDESLVVVMYGPAVLAGELGREGMPDSLRFSNQAAHSGDIPPPVPVLVVDSDEPGDWIKPVEGAPLTFRTSGAGKPEDVSLIPLWNLHHQRYTVYWKTMTSEEWKARPRIELKPAEVSADSLSAGVAYKYYEGSWDKLPDFSALTPVKQGVSPRIDLGPKGRDDHFGLVFTGYLKISEPGEYMFALKSDDGSKLWIGGREVVDHDGIHAATTKQGLTLLLTPGYYPIRVEYFEHAGHEMLEVLWYGPAGDGWKAIPADVLRHARGGE